MKICVCQEWNEDIPIMDTWAIIAWSHGLKPMDHQWNYCPFCGQPLRDVGDDQPRTLVDPPAEYVTDKGRWEEE